MVYIVIKSVIVVADTIKTTLEIEFAITKNSSYFA